ncbi:unnamed protein product [Xylocopa violacea]|uniref:Uncharacterized protein n=1 Tax=Xylocopa violacea TaxID=135666 RepID=A0ABP1PBN8_XYLVO
MNRIQFNPPLLLIIVASTTVAQYVNPTEPIYQKIEFVQSEFIVTHHEEANSKWNHDNWIPPAAARMNDPPKVEVLVPPPLGKHSSHTVEVLPCPWRVPVYLEGKCSNCSHIVIDMEVNYRPTTSAISVESTETSWAVVSTLLEEMAPPMLREGRQKKNEDSEDVMKFTQSISINLIIHTRRGDRRGEGRADKKKVTYYCTLSYI